MSMRQITDLATGEVRSEPYDKPDWTPPPTKRVLSRWSFMAALDQADPTYITAIRATIDAMPPGTAKIRAKYKLEHEQVFRPDAPEMTSVRALLGMSDETFDTLWASAEALEFGP